ncbi:MAG: hypothetical protein E7409_03155 [Ruminococcaceae bacterium]|nr:hypothetical protein [Oscillospiraceae bacterium]
MEYMNFGNNQTKLLFDQEKGYLEKIEYNNRSVDIRSKFWCVHTVNGELTIADMKEFWVQSYGNMRKLFWKSDAATVTVTLRTEFEKIYFGINVDLYGENAVNEVEFPIVEGMKFSKENYMLTTWQNGCIIKNPVENLLSKGLETPFWMGRGKYEYTNDYPAGLSFQYASFYSPEEYGYYFATEDAEAYIKSYTYRYNEKTNGLDFVVTNYPANMGKTSNYCMPYEFVLQMFEGDWQVATQIYRKWAIEQKWCKRRLTEKHIPENVKKTDLWRVNHTNDMLGVRTQEYFDTSLFLRDTMDCNLALHWYGWNLNPEHDWDTPDYFNDECRAMGWPETLKEWNKKFDKEGIVKIPYTNGRLWEKKTKSFEELNIHAAAVKDQTGEILNEPWTAAQNLTTICPSCAVFQNKMVDMCREFIMDEGFDGAYLDQIGSFNARLCFDENHPHPRGGGFWWNDSYHTMLRDIKTLLGKERFITTESCCETYIDVFDLFLVLDINFQQSGFNDMVGAGITESVPLFGMIYGDYALGYGSICRFDKPAEQFEYYLMKNTLWGFIPSIEAGTAEELAAGKEHLAATKRAVDFFKAHKDVLLYGRPYEVLDVDCETCSIEWQLKREDGKPFVDTFPAVYAVMWKAADDQDYLFAYNFSNRPQKITVADKEHTIEGKSFYSHTM